ncbi:MaoC family dehydratase N-terminal domain-containing protein [Paracoccus sp. S1E-3]|uniref:FAS1-like dehydratase domain-containing protein n=1 Tax=Paracoccus sp. S1E-3 TaxID=2756130 RepID=UPI001C68B2B3|nr:MaoC family dehydratase N-terminal domain-containing protein [Paracoccus sp. S1E-3]
MTTLADIDFDHLNTWLGRSEMAADVVTPALIDRFRATFGDYLFDTGAAAPLGLHWCLAPAAAPRDRLGPDGHPARGGFLPPVPFQNRMWAGGEVRFHRPLMPGDQVTRTSRIAAITPKDGRSGPLVFVTVDHACHVGGALRIEERQQIVYRPAGPGRPALEPADPDPADFAGDFAGDAVTLFRYSALTFNGHRIHYDYPYVTEIEGYSGLVVHGPLQATLLMNRAAARAGTGAIRFDYRGLSPLIAGQPVRFQDAAGLVRLERPGGATTFEGRFTPL